MESLLLGVRPEGADEYIGWYDLPLRELFRLTWAIDTDYFFNLDSSLMVASKGGFDINILNKMGVKTKLKYFRSLQEVLKQMYGGDKESPEDTPENGAY